MRSIRRFGVQLVLTAVAACTIVAGSGQAGSLPAVSGTWTMASDPGDFIGQGSTYSFSAPADGLELGSGVSEGGVGVIARPGTGDYWQASFTAPTGVRLAPGVYANAQRFSDATHPGLDVAGAGRGCNQTSGSFTVLAISFGPYGYLRSLHLTFEQHCEGAPAALRGELDLVGPEPPAPLAVQLTVDSSSGFDRSDGTIQLQGTITCGQPVQAELTGQASEQTNAGTALAYLDFFSPNCTTTPSRWKLKVASATGTPFAAGTLQVALTLRAIDDWYSRYNNYDPFIYATDTVSRAIEAKPGG
jgi:hypothetical protein